MLALLDGLISQFREPSNILKVLPGSSVEINGPLYDEVQNVRELTYTSSSEQLSLDFEVAHKGYFLGGAMWRGRLAVSPQIPAGEYTLTVGIRGKAPPQPLPPYRIIVYPDPVSRQQSSKSLIRRYLGVSPWLVPPFFLPAILLAFGLVFYLSQKTEAFLAQQGKAEVYRVVKGEGGYIIRFGLGTAHGVQPGAHLTIFDDQGHTAGTVEVEEASKTDSQAVVKTDQVIKPGFIVSRDHV
jgi:hypothetical protein